MLKPKMVVTFAHFQLREVFARDHRLPGTKKGKAGLLKLSPEVSFGCVEEQREEPFHVIVVVKVSVVVQKEKAPANSPPAVEAVIEAEARFEVAGLSVNEFRKKFEDMSFLDRLADQAYPIVNNKLVRLLSEMGFSTKLPLSLPEVETRVQLNEFDNLDEAEVKKSPRKPRAVKPS